MEDILGREVRTGDLVVIRGNGKYNKGLKLGVMSDMGTVRFLKGASAVHDELFLVENPKNEDLEYKRQIIERHENIEKEEEEKKAQRKANKCIPFGKLVSGKCYKNEKGEYFVYLGHGKVINKVSTEFSRKDDVRFKEGYIYINIPRNKEFTLDHSFLTYAVDVKKSRMRLMSEVELENNPFEDYKNRVGKETEFITEYSHYSRVCKMSIDLD